MNHSQRTIEVKHDKEWFRMPKSCFVFTDREERKLDRGEIVTKWDKEFRKRQPDILQALEDAPRKTRASSTSLFRKGQSGNPAQQFPKPRQWYLDRYGIQFRGEKRLSSEIAEILGISSRQVRNRVRSGTLEAA